MQAYTVIVCEHPTLTLFSTMCLFFSTEREKGRIYFWAKSKRRVKKGEDSRCVCPVLALFSHSGYTLFTTFLVAQRKKKLCCHYRESSVSMNKWNVDMGFHYFVQRERHKGTVHYERFIHYKREILKEWKHNQTRTRSDCGRGQLHPGRHSTELWSPTQAKYIRRPVGYTIWCFYYR